MTDYREQLVIKCFHGRGWDFTEKNTMAELINGNFTNLRICFVV